MTPHFNQRLLQNLFQTSILPWARDEKILLTIAAPDWQPPEGVVVSPQKIARSASRRLQRASHRAAAWSELSLHCRSNPLLIFVLEGEADIRVGRILEGNQSDTGEVKDPEREYEVSIYSLPKGSCLIVPPDVAHSDGSAPHWERPHPENASSHIFWVQILSTGAIVHACQSQGSLHTHVSPHFVRDLQLSTMMHFMLERAEQVNQSDAVLRSFLLTLLVCFDQSQNWSLLQSDVPEIAGSVEQSQDITSIASNSHSGAFERACLFIGSHLTDALTPIQIARHAHISVSQLGRVFHTQLDMPVMKYVALRRIEEAKSLLLGTSMSTQEVGLNCGYPQRTHFSRAFKDHTGLSPLAFRRIATQRNQEKPS